MKLRFETNQHIILEFEDMVWSKSSLPAIAAVSNYLGKTNNAKSINKITVDFTQTYWSEVPTILALCIMINQLPQNYDIVFIFNFSNFKYPVQQSVSESNSNKKLKFIAFLRSMDFFASMPDRVRIKFNKKNDNTDKIDYYNPSIFEELIRSAPIQPFLQAVTLIPLEVINSKEFFVDRRKGKLFDDQILKDRIKKISENAALNIVSAGFQKGTIGRQRILLSIDKILQESISNIIEHAYENDQRGGFFAFYARIRSPNSTFKREFTDGLYDASDEFDHSKDVKWTELYISDFGIGLETQIEPWLDAEKEKDEPNIKLIKELERTISSSNRFLRASRLLFDNSLSRHLDRDSSRSPQTGLQDLKRVLTDVGYVDITNCITVNRRRFTTRSSGTGSEARSNFLESKSPPLISEIEQQELLSQFPNSQENLSLSAGTHLIYRTQFSSELPAFGQPGYKNIGWRQAKRVIELYRNDIQPAKNLLFFDKRFSSSSQPSNEDFERLIDRIGRQNYGEHISLFVRLSRNPYKNDVNEWLKLFQNDEYGERLVNAINENELTLAIYFVDVLPVYAGWLIERIRSYSKSKWLTKSGLLSVGVFTNLLHFTIFEKSKNGYFASRKKSSIYSDLIVNVGLSLREMDSESFWRNYKNHPIDEVYINDEIEWIINHRKLGEVFVNEFPKIWGYLDFSTAIQCLERYRVCERALLRFMAIVYNLNDKDLDNSKIPKKLFLPTLVSSDTMTQRLASSVNTLFEEISEFNEDAFLVLSSIVVSGQTKDRTSLEIPKNEYPLNEVKVCFFDRSKGGEFSVDNDFSLLRWMPPEPKMADRLPGQKRIFRTPEVSPHGALDIRIPHVLEQNGQRVENYQRDRTETYADFELLGALQFGHFQKSNRHELINLNLNALIPLAISTSHPSWSWLISSFFDPVRDADSAVVVVYPNQPHAEQIIQELKHREGAKVPSEHVSFISAPFLKSRKTEPIIVSPRLELRLAELLRELGSSKLDYSRIIVRIFDAGVVTGRTMRALEQQIKNVLETRANLINKKSGDVQFETISLVDRSGHPIYGSLLDKYSRQNRRFWRWDVPSLTENGTCRICQARQNLKRLSEILLKNDDNFQKKLSYSSSNNFESKDWVGNSTNSDDFPLWSDNLEDIHLSYLPVDLQKVIFGYYGNSPNDVYLASPLQYISTFSELTRLLHRSDITLNRSMEISKTDVFKDGNLDCLVVLLLSSHLLLFYETFDKFEKVNYAVELFGCLIDFDADWSERNVRTLANSYGMLALYSIETDELEILKGRAYFCEWLRRKHITNPCISRYVEHISGGGAAFPTTVDVGDKTTAEWDSNLLLLQNSSTTVVKRIMDIVGDQRIWHTSTVYRRLAAVGVTHGALQAIFQELLDLVVEAQNLGVFQCDHSVMSSLQKQAIRTEQTALDAGEKSDLYEVLEIGKCSLRQALFDSVVYLGPPSTNDPGWSDKRTIKHLFSLILLNDVKPDGRFLGQLNTAVKNNENCEPVTDLYDYIGIPVASTQLPFDDCVSFVPSLEVKTVVENALLNSRHASRKVRDPFGGDRSDEKPHFIWTWICREDDALVLNLENHCETDPNCGDLYLDRFPGFYAEGNEVSALYNPERKTLTTKVKFNTLVRR